MALVGVFTAQLDTNGAEERWLITTLLFKAFLGDLSLLSLDQDPLH